MRNDFSKSFFFIIIININIYKSLKKYQNTFFLSNTQICSKKKKINKWTELVANLILIIHSIKI